MGSPSATEKQAILDEIDLQLSDLGVSGEERSTITRPFVQMIGFDFYMLFTRVLQKYAATKHNGLIARANASQKQEDRDALQRHSDTFAPWSRRSQNDNPLLSVKTNGLEDELNKFMPKPGEWMTEKELGIAEPFKQEIARLYRDCEKKGGFTAEAAAFYERTSKTLEDEAIELFKAALEDIK